MNILFLTLSCLHDLNLRGIYSDLMRKFVKDGHDVYIVVPFERRMERKTELFESVGAHILGVKTLNIQKTNVVEKGIGTILLEQQYMTAIRRHLKDIHFDLVLYSTPPITFNKIIGWAKNKYNAMTYLLLKDIFPQNAVDLGMFSKSSLIYKLFRAKERKLYALSDYIGCMSPANVEYVLKHNPSVNPAYVEVCPNSVELSNKTASVDATEIKNKYGIPTDKNICIYGGNLGKPQGIDFLIDTINSNEKRSNAFFLIAGNGTEFNRLKNWFTQNKPCNAKLIKTLPKPEYDCLMRSADVGLIFLDRRFTIPNYPSRLLSYLENKIPIMMATDANTDIGTIAETNGYGLWVESGNIEEFDKKLDSILANQAIRVEMGNRGYKFLTENYTIDYTSNTIMSHFEK